MTTRAGFVALIGGAKRRKIDADESDGGCESVYCHA